MAGGGVGGKVRKREREKRGKLKKEIVLRAKKKKEGKGGRVKKRAKL